MNAQLKLGLYVVTVVGTLLFGTLFLQSWRRSSSDSPASGKAAAANPARPEGAGPAKAATKPDKSAKPAKPGSAATNEAAHAASSTNGAPTKAAGTNVLEAAGRAAATGDVAVASSETTLENEVVPMRMENGARPGLGRMIIWGLLAAVSLVGLGFLGAYDVAHYTAGRATQLLFDDRGPESGDNEYEKIEKVYGNGEYLEAVRMLRDFLKANPKAVHAQLRIAEIYEKDLGNPLAAALEYEEVLQLPLEPNRRGWAAIHLVNLYNRLDREAQAVALMQRICVECADTPAAGKARERLAALGHEIPQAPIPGGEDPAAGGLPPGFKRKR